jgi:hypothetical protein
VRYRAWVVFIFIHYRQISSSLMRWPVVEYLHSRYVLLIFRRLHNDVRCVVAPRLFTIAPSALMQCQPRFPSQYVPSICIQATSKILFSTHISRIFYPLPCSAHFRSPHFTTVASATSETNLRSKIDERTLEYQFGQLKYSLC